MRTELLSASTLSFSSATALRFSAFVAIDNPRASGKGRISTSSSLFDAVLSLGALFPRFTTKSSKVPVGTFSRMISVLPLHSRTYHRSPCCSRLSTLRLWHLRRRCCPSSSQSHPSQSLEGPSRHLEYCSLKLRRSFHQHHFWSRMPSKQRHSPSPSPAAAGQTHET
ncbi:hypothetical protein FA13DRAFT_101474 [Coprinellus micaceus]|uniref:Uncharacterized protein n=1 Tax=Coprinellus micaceus TaxID=71717 RepID=A0A4Y7SIK4_COPMI|nr:hypothetical protein FA13DRAFT_101474 [Coprinellus micaceus]